MKSLLLIIQCALPIFLGSCMTSQFVGPSSQDCQTLVARSIGERSSAHFVLEGENLVSKATYFVECPDGLNRKLARAVDLKREAQENIPLFADKLRKSSASIERPKALKTEKRFRDDSITFEIRRDPDSFDPTSLNLIWTVPVDVATSPFQLIFILIMSTQIVC